MCWTWHHPVLVQVTHNHDESDERHLIPSRSPLVTTSTGQMHSISCDRIDELRLIECVCACLRGPAFMICCVGAAYVMKRFSIQCALRPSFLPLSSPDSFSTFNALAFTLYPSCPETWIHVGVSGSDYDGLLSELAEPNCKFGGIHKM